MLFARFAAMAKASKAANEVSAPSEEAAQVEQEDDE